jgi:hypothetical protein
MGNDVIVSGAIINNGRGVLIRLRGEVPVVSLCKVVSKLEAFLDQS